MVTYPIDHYRKSPMTNGNHKEFPPRVNDIDTFPAIQLLYLLVTFFIIGVSWREYHKNENMKKEKETMKEEKKLEQDQPRKENDQLRKENGKLQNEIDKRKAQFQNELKRPPTTAPRFCRLGRHRRFRIKPPDVIRPAGARNTQKCWQKTSLYPDWRKEFFQAVDITLDPATAHPSLFLSEGNRCVTWGEKSQDLPEDTQRFCSLPCVAGSSGHHLKEMVLGSRGRDPWRMGPGDL